ncbi:HAD family hydrolase [Williamsia sterculiae]|uniref:Cof subfamily of IIB subfamily of haloacid dehalogenase superfamily/HAD-superfamily hydrolase, subfamily IIB n=1 Tax=Williamsia sterculiae TaxID=1344003 RepID=A0A1N7H8K5_9NOCA|nr:HAD family hydrolase [Williamsia sterculiae]SIS21215.1 hypothetical protein SAMN05445060_3698 [Williamsia sterculiae]
MRRNAFGPPTLIASDVDGTLIDDDNRVQRLTATAIRRAGEVGVPLVLATGRPPRWLAEVADQLDTSPYAVCANGAILYDISADRVLTSTTLEVDVLAQLAELASHVLPGCGLAAERVGASAHDTATPPFVAVAGYQHAWLNPDHLEVSNADLVSAPAVKLLIRCPGMRSGDMTFAMREALTINGFARSAEITYSTDNGLIELAPPGVSKATGLSLLAEVAVLPADSVIAFGDMPNDVDMLRWAGRGVAMANAHPLARAAADEITTGNNNDGVGRVLWRWFG